MMIRAFVTSLLGGLLLLSASPGLAEKAPPRPAKTSRDVRPAPPAQNSRAGNETADGQGQGQGKGRRSLRTDPQWPHPFRDQLAAEGRV